MKNLANKITVARICLVPLFMIFLYSGAGYLAFAVYILACVSDFFDGYIARNYNQVSTFGKFMDPLADKVLVIAAMCWFVQALRFPGWALALVCFREFAVSGLRLIAAEKGQVIAAAKSGKIKTASTMVALAVMLFFANRVLDVIAVIVITVTTLYSGYEYFKNNKGVFNS